MCGAPDRRYPLAALAQPPPDTTHVSVTKPPTPTLPPSGTNPAPLPLLPYAPDSLLPPSPFIPARAFRTLQVLLPVNNTFRLYEGWLYAVLLITGIRLQRLYLQPPSDINPMSMVHAVRGLGTRKFTDSTQIYRNHVRAARESSDITVGERTVALKIIACCSITQTTTGQWNIYNVAN